MSCFPLCELSICDTDVLLTSIVGDATLLIKKGSYVQCSYEITNVGGDIMLTDTEILDFGDVAHIYTIQLKQNSTIVPILYYDCDNVQQAADAIRLRFNDCTSVNNELNEVCF